MLPGNIKYYPIDRGKMLADGIIFMSLIEGKHKIEEEGSSDKRGIAVKCQFETYESMGNEYQLRILKSKKRFTESNLLRSERQQMTLLIQIFLII